MEGDPMTALMTRPTGGLTLKGCTAADLMTPNPQSIRDDATLREAIAFLVDRNVSGAPVIDEAGRPVGVLSQTDVLVHDREEAPRIEPEHEYGSPLPPSRWDELQFERVDATLVRDLMTPAVFCVAQGRAAREVVEQMRELNVHRLFVVDNDGVLIGVISAMDIVRHLSCAE
jgi:CBS domain-containing protein